MQNTGLIHNYEDFIRALLTAGFSMGGGNNEGIISLIPWGWNEQAPYDTPVRWHTGDPDTDPWEWRIRVLDERDDIAYSKFFFKKSGYITRAWAPYFLAVRRGRTSFRENYADGRISHEAKRIYEAIAEHHSLPLHDIKQLAHFGKEEKSAFDRAMLELQMKMHITMCGRQQKVSRQGEEYGWSSTVFCLTERFWGEEVWEEAARLDHRDSIEKLTAQVLELNPQANPKKIMKFITGE